MTDQEQVLGRPMLPEAGHGTVPEQRGPVDSAPFGDAGVREPGDGRDAEIGRGEIGRYEPHAVDVRGPRRGPYDEPVVPSHGSGAGRLRVDARRNLESVLRAARQVFGELGYDAPMEEVARRAGVGVGTVYRRFPSKEVLVQRIAAEEVTWLTVQARESLYGSAGPWDALAGYLARAVGSGAGRLLPPSAFRYAEELGTAADQSDPYLLDQRVPEQRLPGRTAQSAEQQAADADPRPLLDLLAALVARAGAAGELRSGVSVSDVVLVLTAAVPVQVGRSTGTGDQPSTGQQDGRQEGRTASRQETAGQPGDAPADRLLQILLHGLRAR